jgi:hypothetical protein
LLEQRGWGLHSAGQERGIPIHHGPFGMMQHLLVQGLFAGLSAESAKNFKDGHLDYYWNKREAFG